MIFYCIPSWHRWCIYFSILLENYDLLCNSSTTLYYCVNLSLTHWGWGKMVDIMQMTYSVKYCWIKSPNFYANFIVAYCHASYSQQTSISWDNGFVPNGRPETWTNFWGIYVSLCLDELSHFKFILHSTTYLWYEKFIFPSVLSPG